MRMRKKDWARPELAACPYYTDTPEALKGNWQAQYAKSSLSIWIWAAANVLF